MAHPEAEAQIVRMRLLELANKLPKDSKEGTFVVREDLGVSDEVVQLVIAALDKDGIKAFLGKNALFFEWK